MSLARKITLGLTAAIVVSSIALWLLWVRPTRYAVAIGAGMLAKQVCSCIYVADRGLDDCRADQFASMDPIEVEVLDGDQRVRAWIPLLGERSAIHREGFGCTLE